VVDNFPGTGQGYVYMISRRFGTGPGIYVFRSTDQGATFTPNLGVNITTASPNQGAYIEVGPDHSVYAFWYAGTSIQVRKSTDFGVTFGSPITVVSGLVGGTNGDLGLTGIRQGTTTASSFRSSEFPHVAVHRPTGRLYVTFANRGTSPDKADVFYVVSSDGGATWSAATKVNDDATTTDQWQPTIAITPNGTQIGIFYYSRQEDSPANNLFKYYGRLGRISGGVVTWDSSFAVSDVPSLPEFGRDSPVNTVYMGDYNHAVATNTAMHVVWSDNRDDLAIGPPRKDPNVYYDRIVLADPVDPNPPSNLTAFSDYSTPTSMSLRWTNPTTLVNGNPIPAYVTRIRRNGVQITERPQGDSAFVDTGLTDGTPYTYILVTRLTGNDSLSSEIQASWVAGGARTPQPPTSLGVRGTSGTGYTIRWRNPSRQTDGTRLDDFAGIRLFRDGVLLRTLTRAVADTARLDSTTDTPPSGIHVYTAVAIDNESPLNASVPSNAGTTPLDIPFSELFPDTGAPDANRWVATGVSANQEGVEEPSAPNALNLNGSPASNGDELKSQPIDLTGLQSSGVTLAYFYQPRGLGDNPETADSLIVEFLNSNGTWVEARKYPGLLSTAALPPFTFEAIQVSSVSPGSGTFFYNGFQFRFRSRGTAGTLDDDWYVDDVFFGVPSGPANIGVSAVIAPAGQAANNTPLTPSIRVINASPPTSGAFTARIQISGPGTTYNGTAVDSAIAGGASKVVTFSPAFTPNAVGQWNVTATVTLPGDPSRGNDTLRTTFFAVNPLVLPFNEPFAAAGPPDPLVWANVNAVVNTDGSNEPSAPYALNLAGNPGGVLDTVTSVPANLAGMGGMGVTLAYQQQPQGTGDVPETADSLIAEALNSLGDWIRVRTLPGAALRPFALERVNLDSVPSGGGSFFHSGFRFRFRSRATSVTTTRQDDWFVDDVFLGIPNTTPRLLVSPLSLQDTVLVGTVDSAGYPVQVRNTNVFGTALSWNITESPAVPWLSVVPNTGSVPGGAETFPAVRIDFRSQPAGTYTTNLVVTSNDPGNPSDTVAVRFLVNPAPVVQVQPDSLRYVINRGDSISSTVLIRNTGPGLLIYNGGLEGGFAGQTSTDIGNTENNLTTTSNLIRGGVVGVTTPVQLLEIRSYLNIATSRELRFIVYENTAQTGTFTKILEVTVPNSGTGTQFYTSGPVALLLEAGKFYAIGVNWNGGLNYYWDASAPVPIPTSFGTITGGLAATTYPPPPTLSVTATTSLYYTQILTAEGRWLSLTTNPAGTVAPGDSIRMGFKVRTAQLQAGSASASVLVNSNDPATPTARVRVSLSVVTDVAEGAEGIPADFELGANYPNPFNPVTHIRFGVPQESDVTLKVYDLLGRQVAVLAEGRHPAGYFTAAWDTRSSAGTAVSTGVYFYVMEGRSADGIRSFRSVGKMVLLK
jgi:hypothetical protein